MTPESLVLEPNDWVPNNSALPVVRNSRFIWIIAMAAARATSRVVRRPAA